MLGSTDYRGRLLAVLSLNELLGMPRPPAGARTRMVVVWLGAHQAGLVVDAAKDVLRVDPRRLEAVPPILSRGRGEARIAAICRLENGARLVSVLSPEQLLDAATLDALAAFGATEAAATAAPAAAADATRRLVAFRIGNEIYALPLEIVDEVVRSPGRLARVPHAPALLRGVMNLRGRVVPVIDPSVRFASRAGVAARTGNESTGRVVIVTIDGVRVGLAVDELRDILSLPAEALRPAPELTPLGDRMVDRVALGAGDGSMMLVLDPQAVLAHAERDLLTDIARRAGNQASA
jgi:purine-binding chemotaxis protein CheW